MSRPAGATASAVVAIMGSVFTLLMAAFMFAAAFMDLPQTQPAVPGFGGMMIGTAVFLAGLAGLGIATAVGLLRMRPWARISIQVFATFIAAISLIALITVPLIPVPPQTDPAAARIVRPVTLVMFGVPLIIAVWWLVQFNTRATKAAFASPTPGTASRRPLSISIIAWFSIIGGVSCLMPILMRMPAFLFGVTLTGWTAGVLYAFFGAVSLYFGRGLLELRERARIVAIAWYAFTIVHMSIVTLVPTVRQRMLEMQSDFQVTQASQPPFDMSAFTNVTFAFITVLSAVVIWFLVRNRQAFQSGNSEAPTNP